jgi:dTDP-4-dehydrorhamnose reductase
MSVLVTGAGGFLGRTICRLWEAGQLGSGHEPSRGASDNREDQSVSTLVGTIRHNRPLLDRTTLVPCDMASTSAIDALLEETAPSAIIHAAALTDAERCELEPDTLHRINVEATQRLARWAAARQARFLFTSTDLVFDGTDAPYGEEDPPRPLSRYGQSKVEAEQAVLEAHPEALIVRLAIMYGWGSGAGRSFIDWFMGSLAAGKPVTLYADEVRSFLYVGAAARALWELAADRSASGIVHLGGADNFDRYRFGVAFADAFSLDKTLIRVGSIEDHPGRARRPRDVSLLSGRAEALLGRRMPGVAEGLEAMVSDREVLG